MRNEIILGKGIDKIKFNNLDDDYAKPTIYYEKDTFWGCREFELESWQIDSLINLVERFMKSKLKLILKGKKDLIAEIKQLDKRKKALLAEAQHKKI